MATYTSNYNLLVPELSDSPPDITQIGGNFNRIDQLLKDCFDRPAGAFYLYETGSAPLTRQTNALYGHIMKKFF